MFVRSWQSRQFVRATPRCSRKMANRRDMRIVTGANSAEEDEPRRGRKYEDTAAKADAPAELLSLLLSELWHASCGCGCDCCCCARE